MIVNQNAGGGRSARFLPDVLAAFRAAGYDPTVWQSSSPAAAQALAAQVPVGGTLVVVGGDGSLHSVLPQALEQRLRVGLIPAGSGDDVAYALGIPRHNPLKAVETILAGRHRAVDVGLVNGTPFINAFGSGFDAHVAWEVQRAPRLLRDRGRYLYGIARAMALFRLQPLELEFEGADGAIHEHRGPALLVSVQNGPRGGGSFLFAPGAQVDDGLLDVVVAGAFGRIGTLAILGQVMRGAHEGHPEVFRFGAKRLTVRWPQVMPAHAEGELLESAAQFEVLMLPAALQVLAPAPHSSVK